MSEEKPSIAAAPAGPLLLDEARAVFGQHVRDCSVCRVPTAPLCKKGSSLYRKLRKLAEPSP